MAIIKAIPPRNGFFIYIDHVNQLCFNGKMIPESEPVLLASNRSYRYGDGLFETMRLKYGAIIFGRYHFDRLFDSLSLLKYTLPGNFNREKIEHEIIDLSHLNDCTRGARIRLSVYRGNGNLVESANAAEYIIECEKLETPFQLNKQGLRIDIYPFAQKPRDTFSNLKSSSYLHSVMAAKHAQDHQFDDCILLNCNDDIVESSVSNIFIIKNSTILTPPLSEGCVHGVMRRYLLETLMDTGYEVEETVISPSFLADADEVFLTNAIRGIQWVGSFRDKIYKNELSETIFNRFIRTIQS